MNRAMSKAFSLVMMKTAASESRRRYTLVEAGREQQSPNHMRASGSSLQYIHTKIQHQ